MLRQLSVTPRNLSLPHIATGLEGSTQWGHLSHPHQCTSSNGIVRIIMILYQRHYQFDVDYSCHPCCCCCSCWGSCCCRCCCHHCTVPYLPPTQLRKRQGHVICPVPLGSNRFQASWRWHQAFHSEVAIQGWWELDSKAIKHPKKSTISFFMRSLNKKNQKYPEVMGITLPSQAKILQ